MQMNEPQSVPSYFKNFSTNSPSILLSLKNSPNKIRNSQIHLIYKTHSNPILQTFFNRSANIPYLSFNHPSVIPRSIHTKSTQNGIPRETVVKTTINISKSLASKRCLLARINRKPINRTWHQLFRVTHYRVNLMLKIND